MTHGLSLVIPVKETSLAETRLALPVDQRLAIALELAAATLDMALASRVVNKLFVVTSSPRVAATCHRRGAVVVSEPPERKSFNEAAELGRVHALAERPDAPVGILVSDLPLLRPSDIDMVASQFYGSARPIYVADLRADGTSMVLHGPNVTPPIRFGSGSAKFHADHGYVRARGSLAGLRTDLVSCVVG